MKKRRISKKVLILGMLLLILLAAAVTYVVKNRSQEETEDSKDSKDSSVSSEFVSGTRYYEYLSEETDVVSDVVYGSALNYKNETEELKLDVYTASGDTETNRPAVILLHGGGLVSGDKATDGFVKSLAIDLAKMGYVTFDVNYRLASEFSSGALTNAMEDIATAFNWIQDNSETYGIDKNNITIAGYSAGALVAQNLCYSNLTAYQIDRSSITAIIDLSGGQLYYGSAKEGNPPCLIIHGTKDTTDPYSLSESFVSTLESSNVSCELYPLEGLNHTLTSRYDEIRNKIAMYLYKQLTGLDVTVDITAEKSAEYLLMEDRLASAETYEAKQITPVIDGVLDEWGDSEVIELNQIKDAGSDLPDSSDFSGSVMVAWNEDTPSIIYIGATIVDDTIVDINDASGKWYNDDCLEIAFDLSDNLISEQITKWVVGATGNDLSVLATSENTEFKIVNDGNTYTYEIAIDLSKIDSDVLQADESFSIIANKVIGFSISYNDSDFTTRESQIGWTSGKSSDRSSFGNLCFVTDKAVN